jgi:hypothetical protein
MIVPLEKQDEAMNIAASAAAPSTQAEWARIIPAATV